MAVLAAAPAGRPTWRLLALLLVGMVCLSAPARAAIHAHHGAMTKPAAAEEPEEGDDGADEPPQDPNRPMPTEAELRSEYQLRGEDAAALPPFVAPKLPDLTKYTPAALEARLDRSRTGSVSIGSMLDEAAFRTLTSSASDGFAEFSKRQRGGLRAIFVENGYVTLPQLAQALPREVFEETAPGVFIARLPLVIRHGATLHLDRRVTELRLSQDRGALIANEGSLFVVNSRIYGWNETADKPAYFVNKHQFRPFIVGWGGSETYISGSRIAYLGYSSTKAYGLSLSQYGPTTIQNQVWPRPTGWLLNSEIENLWYGFYSFEADDVVMRGNTLKNNIKYGFDPHDRSRRLIIAENEVYGTRIKHGIIISREVRDSWIFHNRTHDNGMSGIMLDRQCSNNVVAENLTFKNGTDGVAISESPHNLVWKNAATGNLHHGFRVRNSTDIRIQDNSAIANGLTGVYGNTRLLDFLPRDLARDPYTQQMTLLVVGGEFTSNGTGPIGLDDPTRATFYDVSLRAPKRALGFRFGGMFVVFQNEMLDLLINQKKATVLERRSASAAGARPPNSIGNSP